MPVTAGPIYPGIKKGLVFAIDPANKDSYLGTGTTVTDMKGTNNGTLQSSGMFENTNSGVFNFDGVDNNITLSNFASGNQMTFDGELSIVAWVKSEGVVVYGITAGGFGSANSFYRFYPDAPGGNRVDVRLNQNYIGNGFEWNFADGGTPIQDDIWQCYTLTRNSSNVWTFYLNTTEYTTNQPTLSGTFRIDIIGQIYSSSPRMFQGDMGPVLIYNRALSAGEVLENYNRLKGRLNNIFTIDYLVVAGGASGGGGRLNGNASGGGGAGGVRTSFGSTSGGGASSESSTSTDIGISFTVTVGAGGAVSEGSAAGNDGTNSVFSIITSIGGGGGGSFSSNTAGRDGGSGGGGGSTGGNPGSGTANQGFDGGDHGTSANYRGGGGGGASEAGGSGTASGDGGDGLDLSSILGTSVGANGVFGGGGSGGVFHLFTNPGSGGTGGGGTGGDGGNSSTPTTNATAGTANTGGGGGGAPSPSAGGSTTFPSGAGGSGVVILRYPSTRTISVGAGLTSSTSTSGDFKITVFTAGTDTISFS